MKTTSFPDLAIWSNVYNITLDIITLKGRQIIPDGNVPGSRK